ncbi:MAG TPA: AAA family ATPase [Fimbriimonadaceae bacterium]|nr:AAA family ATPase [Fimbriimonadaceae bacterium]HRJ33612.1 AAA family ATPase [Fimbriimonadaceae bacterium]
MEAREEVQWFTQTYHALQSEIRKAIVGQEEVVEAVLIGLASNGHVLLEGMPGLGKTRLVHALAKALNLQFSRIQFTPDLMPADITGTNVYQSGQFEFRRGPLFANVILADEINRATPKTQSAMLEAMQEHAITVGGTTYPLLEPFLVMATQNPIEQEGTYPLPEAQLDRFMFKVLVGSPNRSELSKIVLMTTGEKEAEPQAVADGHAVLKMRSMVRQVPMAQPVLDYALSFVLASHPDSPEAPDVVRRYVRFGSSPRGAQALVSSGRVRALLAGRFNVARDDIRASAKTVLRHRLLLNFEAAADRVDADQVIEGLVQAIDTADRDPVRI